MRPWLDRGSRRLSFELVLSQRPVRRAAFVPPTPSTTNSDFTCLRCQLRALSLSSPNQTTAFIRLQKHALTRSFTTTSSARREQDSTPKQAQDEPSVAEPNLPSNLERRRTTVSKRLSTLTDSLLTSLNNVSHQVNTYTGTDYTPINTLRNAISGQESSVRTSHEAVASAKEAYDAAHSQQISSQKEVVGLLERKSSWTAVDLERYMALIRSEHVNEQDVTTSLATLREKERELEEGRRQLEKMERQQYHEEQIWSDTIRRNSTWVTIGLMGVNILLLLVNIVGVEPWRRRRLVKEVKRALDEKVIGSATAAGVQESIDKDIDAVTDPHGVLLETIEQEEKAANAEAALTDVGVEGAIPVALETEDVGGINQKISPRTETRTVGANERSSSFPTWKEYVYDMFSERLISLRRIDVTYAALQGAATGVAFMGIVFVVLRPK